MLVVVSYIICCIGVSVCARYPTVIVYISLGRLPLSTLDLDGSLLMVMTLELMFLFVLLQEPSRF